MSAAGEHHASLRRRDIAGDQVEQGGLAGAVGADHGERLAGFDRKAHGVHGFERAVGLGHRIKFQKHRHERLLCKAAACVGAAAVFRFPENVSGILNRRERPVERDVGRRLVEDDVQVVLELRPFCHCPPTSGVMHTFGTGLVGPPFQVIGPTID